MSLKKGVQEATKRGNALCNCFYSGYTLHSLYYNQSKTKVELKSDEIEILTNKLNKVSLNLHDRVENKLYPDPSTLLSLTTEIYNNKWKFITNSLEKKLSFFPSNIIPSNICKFISNNGYIKDPRLLFINDKSNDNDEEIRLLTQQYCVRMSCLSLYIHPKLDKEIKGIDLENIDNISLSNFIDIDNIYIESFIKCIKYYYNNNYLMCLLFATSFIEKLLGDLLLNINNNNIEVPHNIIDLLMSSQLIKNENIINNDLHLILFCLIGPPFSCNIRNLSWHGFFNNQQMIPKHKCSFLLYIIQQLLFEINKDNNKILLKCPRKFQTILLDKFSSFSSSSSSTTKLSKCLDIKSIKYILKQSYFIPIQNHKDFLMIFKKYKKKEDDKDKDYYEIASVLFCILENSIRRIIVSISNESKENNENKSLLPVTRILAEDDILYLSFAFLSHRDLFREKINFGVSHKQLSKWLSYGFMFLLQDLIIANNGPRFRDYLAHFQVNSKQISPILVDTLMNICIFGILRFSWNDLNDNDANNNKDINTFCNIYQFVNNYRPCYHPLSFCINEWKEFKNICQQFQIYSAKHFSIDVISVQCGNKMININKVLQKTIKLVNLLQNLRKKKDDKDDINNISEITEITETPLKFMAFINDYNRFKSIDQLNEDEKNDDFEYILFENMNQSIIKNITKMLEIINPAIKSVMNTHKIMDKDVNNDNQEISSRKLKQYSKLTHGLSLWSCCLDIIYESILCSFCLNINIPYKLWSKYLQSATKMQNKLRSNQYNEAVLQLIQCIDQCQNWLN